MLGFPETSLNLSLHKMLIGKILAGTHDSILLMIHRVDLEYLVPHFNDDISPCINIPLVESYNPTEDSIY